MFSSFCGVVTGIINKIKKTSLMFHVSAPSASNLGYDLGEILSSGHGTFSLEWERARMCQSRSDYSLNKWVQTGALSLTQRRWRNKSGRSLPSHAEIKNALRYKSSLF
jgi:hypothetical protein